MALLFEAMFVLEHQVGEWAWTLGRGRHFYEISPDAERDGNFKPLGVADPGSLVRVIRENSGTSVWVESSDGRVFTTWQGQLAPLWLNRPTD